MKRPPTPTHAKHPYQLGLSLAPRLIGMSTRQRMELIRLLARLLLEASGSPATEATDERK